MKQLSLFLCIILFLCTTSTGCSAAQNTTPTSHTSTASEAEEKHQEPMDDSIIRVHDLSKEELISIETTSLDFLVEFFTQSASESPKSREERLELFVAPNNTLNDVPLYPHDAFSSRYALIEETKADRPEKIEWSVVDVKENRVVVYATINIHFTDVDDFQDSNHSIWFITLNKTDDKWLVYGLEKMAPENAKDYTNE